MDYIYKDGMGNKQVGAIDGLETLPFYEFHIEIDGRSVWCYLEHILNEWNLHLIEYQKQIELAHPKDTYWNAGAIDEIVNNEETSNRIAYALKIIYEKYNDKKDESK